ATIGQTPFVDRLPLVIAAPRPKTAPASVPAQRAPLPEPPEQLDPDADADFDELLAEARRLFDVAHPAATKMWERVAVAAARRGIELDAEAQAQLAEERAADALDREDMER